MSIFLKDRDHIEQFVNTETEIKINGQILVHLNPI